MVWSYPKYQAFLSAQRTFRDAAIHVADAFTIGGDDGAERVLGESVSARYFSILGLAPQRGRFFLDSEDRPTGGDRSIVISDGYWRERYGGAESALGSTIELNGRRYAIVGIAPPGFAGMSGMSAPAVGKPTEHWRVESDKTVIIPPVTYGRLPTGAQSAALVPLTSNQDYHISIYIPDRSTAVGDGSWHQP